MAQLGSHYILEMIPNRIWIQQLLKDPLTLGDRAAEVGMAQHIRLQERERQVNLLAQLQGVFANCAALKQGRLDGDVSPP